jgi:hypothetical protein
MVDALAGPLCPFLRGGDEIDLVSGNHDRPLSVPTLSGWFDRLRRSLPPSILYAAHTSGLENVRQIAAQAPTELRSILLDYEPTWDPQFTWDVAGTLAHLGQFAQHCRAGGRRAVGYPTGRPLLEAALQAYRWDYAEMQGRVDDLYPQTQHWATRGVRSWASALEILRAQRRAHQLDPAGPVAQLTIGDRDNGLLATTAIERYREAASGGLGRLFLWWAPGMLGEVEQFLRSLDV